MNDIFREIRDEKRGDGVLRIPGEYTAGSTGMEDLYGKTVNKSLTGLSLHSLSGRVSPVETGHKRPGTKQ